MFAIPNENGVFEPDQCEVLRGWKGLVLTKEGWEVEILIAHVGEADWRAASGVSIGSESWGGWPSKSGQVYETRAEALEAEIRRALEQIKGRANRLEASDHALREACDWLNSQRQLKLF